MEHSIELPLLRKTDALSSYMEMNIKKLVLTSLGWTVSTKAFGQLINWTITLYVIRLLSPEDYGLMAIAMGFISILMPLSELGLGSALIQRKELDDKIIGKTFGFVLLIATFFAASLYLSSPFIATIFDAPELILVIKVLSLSLVALSFAVVPRALLQRNLDFKGQSIVDMVSGIFGGMVALVLAIRGYGVWALVVSNLTTVIMTSGGLVMITRFWQLPNFDFRGLKDIMSFGSWMTLLHFTWLFRAQADVFIIGKMLGGQLLGYYAVAKQISELPQSKLQGILNTIAFPAYSKARTSGANPTYYLEKYLRISSLASFPVFVGISSIAPEFVMVILGEKWKSAILPIQLITLAMPFRVLQAAFSPYLQALGYVKTLLENMLIALTFMVILLIIGAAGGLAGVASAWAISAILTFLIVLYRTSCITDISIHRIVKSIGRMGLPVAFMYFSITFFGISLGNQFDSLIGLILKVSVGAGIYGCCVWIFCRSELQEILDLFGLRKISFGSAKL